MPIITPSPDTSTKKDMPVVAEGGGVAALPTHAAEAQSHDTSLNHKNGPRLLKGHIWKSLNIPPFAKNKLIVFPGMVQIKHPLSVRAGSHQSNAKRGKIKAFSKKSRNGMKKFLCKIATPWRFRFEVTYSDDVMEGKVLEERARKFSHDINLLKKYIERRYPGLWVLWKKEYVKRKSGILQGQFCPHGHFVMQCPEWESEDRRYVEAFNAIAEHWLKITGTTRNKENARKVLYHEKSSGYLSSGNSYNSYMSKWSSYISKDAEEVEGQEGASIGRVWGHMGNIELSSGEEIPLTDQRAVIVQRTLRKYLKSTQKRTKKLSDGTKIKVKPKYPYEKKLRNMDFQGFVIIQQETVQRILKEILFDR